MRNVKTCEALQKVFSFFTVQLKGVAKIKSFVLYVIHFSKVSLEITLFWVYFVYKQQATGKCEAGAGSCPKTSTK